ncbi:MAG: DUF4252 domain-containing protein [Chitinophagaceae bacterium]|nr:DUF4252 domain-containing protein [Chitinophagaceae bacterium]
MKNIRKYIVLLLAFACFTASAQESPAQKWVRTFEGQPGITTISISRPMFRLLSRIKSDDPDYQKIARFSSRLEDFKIMVIEEDKEMSEKDRQRVAEAQRQAQKTIEKARLQIEQQRASEKERAAMLEKARAMANESIEKARRISGNAALKERFSRMVGNSALQGYEDLMTINEEGNHIAFRIMEKDDRIRELIMTITGSDNLLMLIKGDFTLNELSEISDDMNISGMNKFKKLKK